MFKRLNEKIIQIIKDEKLFILFITLAAQAEAKLARMDYNKSIRRRNTNHLLRKENAVIRNISDNKVFEAELIADKDLSS